MIEVLERFFFELFKYPDSDQNFSGPLAVGVVPSLGILHSKLNSQEEDNPQKKKSNGQNTQTLTKLFKIKQWLNSFHLSTRNTIPEIGMKIKFLTPKQRQNKEI